MPLLHAPGFNNQAGPVQLSQDPGNEDITEQMEASELSAPQSRIEGIIMFSLKFPDLLYKARYDPRELGRIADVATLLECLDQVTNNRENKSYRVETLECQLILELTEGCLKV